MTRILGVSIAAALMLAASGTVLADSAGVVGITHFPQRDGQQLYTTICQGCHMPNGKGATGAGTYPSLAADPKLQGAAYPIEMVIYGNKAMPGFGGFLDDAQVAAVVGYVRTHFGNHYQDKVTADSVKPLRQPNYQYFTLD